jgi:hypothetical protein
MTIWPPTRPNFSDHVRAATCGPPLASGGPSRIFDRILRGPCLRHFDAGIGTGTTYRKGL